MISNRDKETKAGDSSDARTEASKQTYYSARHHEKAMDSIVDEFAKKGGFDDLPGKGKPLKLQEGDVLGHVMKEANVLPPWLELRKEIVNEMSLLLARQREVGASIHEQELDALNEKIRKFNRHVPSSLLQKGLVSASNLEQQYEKWL
ncbi:DUF1992 domain-containing protein [Paenibacillus sp. 1001270B_150601_E10]|uniref:DnaJ family domain-containing protein n=1 Tax=Paenibacillus sp. 1001270B_150601_E10 TaxID=2787079 RepID=UPI00189F7192|nr:DUF1992 domain-containing protein [Paenibacillus sp. 1001270B_150601_E10]